MEKYDIGDKVYLKTGSGIVIEAKITKYSKGYYGLESPDSPFPMTLSERSLEKIRVVTDLPQVA